MKLNELLRRSFEAYRTVLLFGHSSRVSTVRARASRRQLARLGKIHMTCVCRLFGARRFRATPPQGTPGIRRRKRSSKGLGSVASVGVGRQSPLVDVYHWLGGISVRSRNRVCRCTQRSEPGAEDRPLAATNASVATCSSGGSPENWRSLR